MAYGISLTKEAKEKAVKPKQIDLRGKEVVEKSNNCYFCADEVDETFADLTRITFGQAVCSSCMMKLVEVWAYAGGRSVS